MDHNQNDGLQVNGPEYAQSSRIDKDSTLIIHSITPLALFKTHPATPNMLNELVLARRDDTCHNLSCLQSQHLSVSDIQDSNGCLMT